MRYAIMKTGKGFEIVCADGSTVRPSDTDRRVFHVLPKLFVDLHDLRRMKCKDIVVRITSAALGDILEPQGGVIVRQPVPNRRYFVGGSRDIRYGWIVPIPEDINEFDLTIEWHIAKGADDPNYTVRHTLLVKLLPGRYHVYSMDMACWHRAGTFNEGDGPLHHQPYTLLLYGQGFQSGRNVEIKYFYNPDDSEEEREYRTRPAIIAYRERLEIPAIPVSDLWSIDAFSEEQLHEINPRTDFQSGNELHRSNACIELPAQVFARAVRFACDIPYGQGSKYWTTGNGQPGQCEQHPALRQLCDWWNRNAPDPDARCAGYVMPWVRVRDDGYYWCGYHETPNTPIENFKCTAYGNARLGDLVLVEFMKGAKDFTFDSYGLQTYHVTGRKGMNIGVEAEEVQSGNYDEAWYALEALATFPYRFPEAWTKLRAMAGE